MRDGGDLVVVDGEAGTQALAGRFRHHDHLIGPVPSPTRAPNVVVGVGSLSTVWATTMDGTRKRLP